MSKIKIGISSCLLGQEVRFDSGHKRDRYITDVLNKYFEYKPFCPEVAVGMGVPRPSIRLQKNDKGEIRALMPKTSEDYTDALTEYGLKIVPKLDELSGYIFKSKSPTCGMERVKIYPAESGKMPDHDGVGLYAKVLQEHLPNLPMEEEGRLNDPLLRENFIKRVFVFQEWQQMVADDFNVNAFIAFHARHKMTLILHQYGKSKDLGRLVAAATADNLMETAAQYFSLFMQTLRIIPQRRHHGQVLTRIVTSINEQLDDAQKQDVLSMIDEYVDGELPLSAPVRLIKHYLTKIDEPYLSQQSYLSPYPDELGLMKSL